MIKKMDDKEEKSIKKIIQELDKKISDTRDMSILLDEKHRSEFLPDEILPSLVSALILFRKIIVTQARRKLGDNFLSSDPHVLSYPYINACNVSIISSFIYIFEYAFLTFVETSSAESNFSVNTKLRDVIFFSYSHFADNIILFNFICQTLTSIREDVLYENIKSDVSDINIYSNEILVVSYVLELCINIFKAHALEKLCKHADETLNIFNMENLKSMDDKS